MAQAAGVNQGGVPMGQGMPPQGQQPPQQQPPPQGMQMDQDKQGGPQNGHDQPPPQQSPQQQGIFPLACILLILFYINVSFFTQLCHNLLSLEIHDFLSLYINYYYFIRNWL